MPPVPETNDLHRAIGRLEGKLDLFLAAQERLDKEIKGLHTHLEASVKQAETRHDEIVRKVEQRHSEAIEKIEKNHKEAIKAIETRVETLESAKHKVLGGAFVLTTLVSIGFNLIKELWRH